MTPWYMLPERADGKRPGVIYAEDLEGAFRGIEAWQIGRGGWQARPGAVVDLAAGR